MYLQYYFLLIVLGQSEENKALQIAEAGLKTRFS